MLINMAVIKEARQTPGKCYDIGSGRNIYNLHHLQITFILFTWSLPIAQSCVSSKLLHKYRTDHKMYFSDNIAQILNKYRTDHKLHL